jgi:hypothetical protein
LPPTARAIIPLPYSIKIFVSSQYHLGWKETPDAI